MHGRIHSYTMYDVTEAIRSPARETENWEAQVRKGSLELAILAILWQGRGYGLEILRNLEEGVSLVMAEGTVYPILARLKADGLVTSEWVESEEGGHPRKYYALTPLGRQRARSMARYASEFFRKVGSLIEPLTKEGKP